MPPPPAGKEVAFRWGDEFVGVSPLQQPEARFEADAVFVGHGIAAPEYNWDDFKGVNVAGKILVLFTNEPPSTDPKFFEGRALTYYGRWTYKYEEALRRGARGVIIIHTTPTASYGWDVVRSSWARETPFVKLGPNDKALGMQGWISQAAGEKLLGLAGHSVAELLAAAEKPDFSPIDLGIRIRVDLPSKVREIETRNVAAIFPGSDPKLKSEAVIFSAHWDHLGIGTPVDGDAIYNGAIDNGTGCAILLELARAWGALPEKPKRSALFLVRHRRGRRVERVGILCFASAHPARPDGSGPQLRRAVSVGQSQGRGADGRRADQHLARGAADCPTARTWRFRRDATPEAGHYFRSDHFSFAHAGIPAFSVGAATEFAGKPAGFGQQAYEEYNSKHYHQPSDEFQADWDFTALEQAAEFGFLLGQEAANQPTLVDWRPGDQFHR